MRVTRETREVWCTTRPPNPGGRHIVETGELGLAEGLRENVGGVNVIKNVRYPNQSSIDVIANPVVRAMHVLHHALVFGMLRDLQGRPVVEEGRRSRLVISDVLEEVPHQHYLASDLGSNRAATHCVAPPLTQIAKPPVDQLSAAE